MVVTEPASAMSTKNDACQKASDIRSEDHRFAVEVLSQSIFDGLRISHEQIFIDDLQLLEGFRPRTPHVVNTNVNQVVDDRPVARPPTSGWCLVSSVFFPLRIIWL